LVVKGLKVTREVLSCTVSRLSGGMGSPPVCAFKTGVDAVAIMTSAVSVCGTVKLLPEPLLPMLLVETAETLGEVRVNEIGPVDPRGVVLVPEAPRGEPPETLAVVNPSIFALLINEFSCWLAVVVVGELGAEN
jgi:hypothetical protein